MASARPVSGVDHVATTRLLTEWGDLVAASALLNGVWDDPTVSTPALLRAIAHAGNPIIGAEVDGELCGASIAFLGPTPAVHLHSHVVGVRATHQHLGIGFALKSGQRDWCRTHGIDFITWTFDPMLARNAHFNLHKLGARSSRLLPSFYGAMDDAFNRGEVTDRLEILWPVRGAGEHGPIVGRVPVPADHLAMRTLDPVAAAEARSSVRAALLDAFASGLEIVDFADGAYLLA